MRRYGLAVVGTAAFMTITAASGCSDDDGGSAASASAPPSSKQSATPSTKASSVAQDDDKRATVKTESVGDLGTILVDAKGRTLYLFESDESTASTCDDDCAEAWPPLLTSKEPEAEGSAKSKLLDTSERPDGKTQVTYNDHPLYRYDGDSEPGDTNGQGLDEFGAEWFVLDADGDKVESDVNGEQGPPGY
ncbi:hypothetical protein [Streptomyces synnematoformans]|uniref:Lipoprotein n=1 Tax=Streptomyces synnematoformans TaxID=415721 RepID=A0ABN2XT82_9ACTN